MGLFSNVLKRVKEGVPQALEQRRNPGFGIGSLTTRPDLEPTGGGFLKRAVRNVNQQIRNVNQQVGPQPSPMLPIMPPSIPGFNIPDLSALQNISPAVKNAVQQSLATGEPILSPERLQEMIDQPPVAPPSGGLDISKSPLQQAFEKIRNSVQPVPVPPGQEGQLPTAPVNTGPIKIFGQTLSQEDSDRIRAGGSMRDYFEKINAGISDEERAKLPSAFAPPPQLGVIKPPQRPIGRPILRKEDIVPIRPREQTGLTAAELLELSDEELQRYIPRRNISQGVGSTRRTYDATPSPEDFRTMLQAQIDLKPDDRGFDMLKSLGPRRYNPIDTSPQPTQDKRLGALLDIRGTGDDLPPIDQQKPMPPPPLPPQDLGFGPGIRPTEIRGPDGRIIAGSAGVTPPDFVKNIENKGPGSLRDRIDVDRFVPPQQPVSNMIAELPPERIAEIGDPIPVTDPVTPPASTTVAANQPPVAPPAPTQPPVTTTDGVGTAPAAPAPTTTTAPAPTTTTAPPQVPGGTPFAAGVTQVQSGLDPLTEQLLFGVGGRGGFIPGAMRAAEKVFYDEQGQPVVIEEQVAGFSPDQLAAMQLQRQSIGMQQPYLDQATQAYFSGLGALQSGIGESLGTAEQGVEDIARGVGEARGLREAGLRGLVGSLDEARGLTRGATDEFGRRISGVETGSQRAARQFARGLGRSQLGLERGVDQFGRRLTDVEGIQRGATGQFGARTAGIAGRGISDVGRFERGLQDPESLLRGSVGGYNQGLTQQFYDPFEERVVQQTIEDIMEQGAKSDIGARAGDIARGGESAFGSRARLGATERTEALGRGLAEALGGIRSSGFQRAQQAGLGEFARQKEAERAAASGLAGLAGQRLGAGQQLTGMLRGLSGEQLAAQQALASGLGSIAGQRLGAGQTLAEFQRGTAGQQLASQQALQNMLRGTTAERLAAQQNLASTLAGLGTTQQQALSQAGQQALAGQQVLGGARTGLAGMQMGAGQALQQGQFGLGSSLQGLGAQAAGASASDIAALYGMGAQQQGMTQAQLDAQRRNLQQRQMTPLLQYQALAPFVSMAPAGQFQTTTQFAPKPSAMMTGIGTGLQAFGALGNLYGGK